MTGSASATSSKICRDRRVGKIRTPDDELRDSLTGSRLPNSIADSPRPNAPAGRHLVARRRRTTPSQIQKPAEGPLFQPSLDLNIDPAPVHPLTRSILPQPPARAPIQSCSSYRPLQLTRITPSSHLHPHDSPHHTCTSSSQTKTLYFLQSGSPLPCTSSSPANPSSVSSTGPGTNSKSYKAELCTSSSQRNLPLSLVQSRTWSVAHPCQEPESATKTARSPQPTPGAG